MMESFNRAGDLLARKVIDLSAGDSAAQAMAAMLNDPAVKEVRSRKIDVGEEVGLGGRTLRLTDAGWRRVDRYDPRQTHELTPMERRLVSD